MRCSSPHWRCDLMMKLPPQVNTAFEMLEAAGYEAYLVGGAVRDYVRDNSPAKDWDITTNALPEQVEEIFTGYHLIETGLKHGTVTVVIDQEPLEITTYRVDGDYSDHRHPDSVSFTRSLKDDLERRDFTMNALAYNPRTGVVDFVGGKADIAGDLVRCVGDPDRRFQEDGLRMLRALRFASVYGMTIEAATAAAIHRNKHLLKGIAAERILVELTKMLCAQGAAGVLRDFADVLAVPIPELTPMFGFPQHNPHHDKDVWDHTIAVIESITPEPVLRWAALLHDIGKPSCFSLAEDGIGHFFGHSDQSTSMAESILSRLRFDNASKEQIVRLVRYGVAMDDLLADEQTMEFLNSNGNWENSKHLIVNMSVPKFDVVSDLDLRDGLNALGITGVFDATVADFSPMTSIVAEIFLSKADHAARVAIDEEGVTAAAYTVMMMAGAAAPPEEEMDFVLDRPFLFAITGADGLPLFVGVVNRP